MLPHWSQNDVMVDGIKLHYTRTGDGSKPPLVLAHGFSDNGLCWLPVARDLEAEYDVILPDARGHGLSARIQPDEEIDMIADLAEFIRALELNQPILGGHSMGANSSSRVEARFPGLVRALVLEDPPWREPEPPKVPEKETQTHKNPMTDWITSLEKLSVDELIGQCRKDNPKWSEVELHPWAESKKQFDLNFVKKPGSIPMDWQEVVGAIGCPTLLITANPAKGAIVNPETAKTIIDMNPKIQLVAIKGAGHNIRRENYPAYMQAVQAFLKGLSQ